MRVVLIVEYDGTAYCGWQIQPNGTSVQETLERCYFSATGEKVNMVASGRTDSGVHASSQVVHFDTQKDLPAKSFKHILNAVLPVDIKIIDSFKVSDDFHARYSAKRKTYVYRTYVSQVERPLKSRYATRINDGFSLEAMLKAKALLEGEHDFSAFSASGSSVKTTVRTVYNIDITFENQDLVFSITGNGFLYNMVRIIVGTILGVGYGKISLDDVKNALETKKKCYVGKTMPACALTLKSVEYDSDL